MILSTISRIASRAAMTFWNTSSTSVNLPRLNCIFFILSSIHFQFFRRLRTSFTKPITLLMRLMGFKGLNSFSTNLITLLTKSTNLSMYRGTYPFSFSFTFTIWSTMIFVILSIVRSISSPVSAIVWIRSLGKSFLKLAEALNAAFPRRISKPILSMWARIMAWLSRTTSKLPPKMPTLSLTWLTNCIFASAPTHFPPNVFPHRFEGPSWYSLGRSSGIRARFCRLTALRFFLRWSALGCFPWFSRSSCSAESRESPSSACHNACSSAVTVGSFKAWWRSIRTPTTVALTSLCSSSYNAFIRCWSVCSWGSFRMADITADRMPELSWSACSRITVNPDRWPRLPKAQMWSLRYDSCSSVSARYKVDLFW